VATAVVLGIALALTTSPLFGAIVGALSLAVGVVTRKWARS
jgi:hypothetical protein